LSIGSRRIGRRPAPPGCPRRPPDRGCPLP
jgi:hypothetical protein